MPHMHDTPSDTATHRHIKHPIRYRVEAALVWLWLKGMRALPLDAASWLGGALTRAIGPCTAAHRTAIRNIALAFPQLPAQETAALATQCWENIGRTVAEFAHLDNPTLHARVQVEGTEYIEAIKARSANDHKGCIFIAGHYGNWELNHVIGSLRGMPMALIHRTANNPWVDAMIIAKRTHFISNLFPKGKEGARQMLKSLKAGEQVGLMIDQKMNDGIAVPFFGHDAMTAPAVAQLALKYDVPIYPSCVRRSKGCHFTLTVDAPLTLPKTGNQKQDIYDAMCLINQTVESWIRTEPAQWFWVHNRWKKP